MNNIETFKICTKKNKLYISSLKRTQNRRNVLNNYLGGVWYDEME